MAEIYLPDGSKASDFLTYTTVNASSVSNVVKVIPVDISGITYYIPLYQYYA